MAYNGSGSFIRLYNWVTDRTNGIKIRADRFDAELDGIASGLSNAICKDGQTTITGDIPLNNHKLTGVGDATNNADALNLQSGDARYLKRPSTLTVETDIVDSDILGFFDASANADRGITYGNLKNNLVAENVAGVASFNSRSGVVSPAGGDYNAGQITVTPVGGISSTNAQSALAELDTEKAPLNSPTFTGTPAGPTPAVGDSTTKLATTAFVITEVAALLPVGTRLLFQQTTPPVGWTKETNSTYENATIRLTTGTIGSGGAAGFTSVFSSRTPSGSIGSITLSQSNLAAHTHTITNMGAMQASVGTGANGSNQRYGTASETTSSVGSGTAFTPSFTGDAMDFNIKYIDLVIGQKA